MRLFVIGDIHGCATALRVILAAINLEPGDRLVTLGDYINKGPDSKAVLEQLIRLTDAGLVIPLLGNHELKLLLAKRLGLLQIGDEILVDRQTLASYAEGHDQPGLDSIPDSHWRFVQDCCFNWLETERHIFVHATVDADQPMTKQSAQALFWNKLTDAMPHRSGKTLVCGHTPQRSGQPLNLGYAIGLDTAVCEGQWLTCLEVNSGQIWQSNQQGELRRSHIQDYRQISQWHSQDCSRIDHKHLRVYAG